MTWYSHLYPTVGLSAQAIASSGKDHPHDPSDLVRCVAYCDRNGISTAALRQRMASRSVAWSRLVEEWDNLVTLLRNEVETRTDGMAPQTYMEMKRVINGGVACGVCAATGRGDECLKCKGTGRRSGGRCRADNCYGGADFCPACTGRGYTTTEKAA